MYIEGDKNLLEMSRQVVAKSRGKPPAKPPVQLPYKGHEPPEPYEEVEMHQEEPLESEERYTTTGPRDEPNQYAQTLRVATAMNTQDPIDTVTYKPTKCKALLYALVVTLMICLMVVSLVAVILYRPQARSGEDLEEDLRSRIQQLERRVDRLRSVDLYQDCTELTRSCTMSRSSISYYWSSCSTSSYSISPTVSILIYINMLNCIQFTAGHSVLCS